MSNPPPPSRDSIGATFKRLIRKLVLPTGHDETTGPVIVIDGTTGKITMIGTNGAKITLDPNAAGLPYPQITFTSVDGTNDSWLNAVSTGSPSQSDIGLTSGKFTPADGVQRRGRLYMSDTASGQSRLEVIKESDQTSKGGFATMFFDAGYLGFNDSVNPQQYVGLFVNGFFTSALNMFEVAGDKVAGGHRSLFAFASGGDTTVSGSMANMAGSPTSVSFVKRFSATALEVFLMPGFYITGAVAGVDFGVLINGVDYLVTSQNQSNVALNNHVQLAGAIKTSNALPAGTYTVQQRWRRLSGAGTITRDLNDLTTMVVREVDAT